MGEGATALFAMKVGFSTPLTALEWHLLVRTLFTRSRTIKPQPSWKS